MPGVVGINPNGVVVAVMIFLVDGVQSFAAVERFAHLHAHHDDAVDVLRVGDDLPVIHRPGNEFVLARPGCAFVLRPEHATFAVSSLNRRVHHVRVGGRNSQADTAHVD